jgi:hypothetical protein
MPGMMITISVLVISTLVIIRCFSRFRVNTLWARQCLSVCRILSTWVGNLHDGAIDTQQWNLLVPIVGTHYCDT